MEEREETTFTPMTEVPQMENNPHTSASVISELCVICGKTEKRIKNSYSKTHKKETLSKFRKEERFGQLVEIAKKLGRDDILATVDGQDSTAFRYHWSCFSYFCTTARNKSVRTNVTKIKMECFNEMMGTVISPRLVDLREVWSLKNLNRIFSKLYREKIGYKISRVSFVKDHIQQHYPGVRCVGHIGQTAVVYFPSGSDDQLLTSIVNVVLSESDTDSDSDIEPDDNDVPEVKCCRSRCASAEHKVGDAARVKRSDADDRDEWRPGRNYLDQWSTSKPKHSQLDINKAQQLNLNCLFSPDCPEPGLVFPITDKRWETLLRYSEEWKKTEAPERNIVLSPEVRKTKGYHDFCYLRFIKKRRLLNAKLQYAKKMGTYQEKKEVKPPTPELLPRLRSHRLSSGMTGEAVQQKRSSPASQTQSCPVPKKPKLNDDDRVLDTESQQEGCLISEMEGDVGSCSKNETAMLYSKASLVNEASEKTVNHTRNGEGRTGGRTVQETGQTADRDTAAQANDNVAMESDRNKSMENKATQPQLPCVFSDYFNCQESSAQVLPFTDIRWRSALHCSAEWRAIGEPEGKIVLLPEDREKKGYHNSCYVRFTAKTRLRKAKLRYSSRKQSLQTQNEVIKKETKVETSQSHSSCDPSITTEAVEQGQSSEDSKPQFPMEAQEEKQCNCYVKLVKLEPESQ